MPKRKVTPSPVTPSPDAACAICGCTEEWPCFGGCRWAGGGGMVDVCSRCASPTPFGALLHDGRFWIVAPGPFTLVKGAPPRRPRPRAMVGFTDFALPAGAKRGLLEDVVNAVNAAWCAARCAADDLVGVGMVEEGELGDLGLGGVK